MTWKASLPTFRYLVLDWSSGLLSFVFMAVVFRFSSEGAELGVNAWLLSLTNAMLFVSVAVQYYGMLRGASALQSYLSFLPVALLEAAAAGFVLQPGQWVIAVLIVTMNLFVAAYRGELMAKGNLTPAAAFNLAEQLLRLAALVLCVYGLMLPVSEAMLISIVAAYAVTFIAALALSTLGKNRIPRKLQFKESIQFSCIYLGIYLISSADVVALKSAPGLLADYALVKPWGLGLFTITIPMINIALLKIKRMQSLNPIIRLAVVLYILVFAMALGLGDFWNGLFLHKSMPSNAIVLLVLLEHTAMAMLSALFQTRLQEGYRSWETAGIALAVTSFLWFIPAVFKGIAICAAYVLILTAACGYVYIIKRLGFGERT